MTVERIVTMGDAVVLTLSESVLKELDIAASKLTRDDVEQIL